MDVSAGQALPASAESNWRVRGACRTEDPELFFPVPSDHQAAARAKEICAGCPVLAECLNEVLTGAKVGGRVSGIWGGTSEYDRLKLAAGRKPGRSKGTRTYLNVSAPESATKTERIAR